MTDIERAFLADIAAQPQDDFPRLAYADWLEENGQEERAEFIRVQCELTRFPTFIKDIVTGERLDGRCTETVHWVHCPDQARCSVLRRRERELLSFANLEQWGLRRYVLRHTANGSEFAKLQTERITAVLFHRGFISRITLPCAAFLEHAADIIEAVPMLEEVKLSDVEPEYSAMRNGWVYYDPRIEPLTELGEIPHFARCAERKDAEKVLSNYCLMFAREQLAARRTLTPTH